MSYRGSVSHTASNKICQPWVNQRPHPHPVTPLDRPELERHNHCRNPDGRSQSPWCYTTDPNTRWEECDIPVCSNVQLPVYSYPLMGVGGALILCLLGTLLCCCCWYCCRRSKRRGKQTLEQLDSSPASPSFYSGSRYAGSPQITPSCGNKTKPDVTENPLYAVNPLCQQPIEYDGMKLPECPRDNIFYVKDLGQGHFGVVVQAELVMEGGGGGKEKTMVAVKVLKEGASGQAKKEFFREATLMHTFTHPNLLRLVGVCVDQEPLCMVFEFMELGDLNNFLRQNSPHHPLPHQKTSSSSSSGDGCVNNTASLTRSGQKANLTSHQLVCLSIDVAAGLNYLAQNHFVHRDLATRNCLVSRSLCVKISDFGLSQDIYSTDYFKMGDAELLPIRWMPPEAILYAKFTTQSDVWSFGVVLWEIFSFGIQPYFTMSNEEVVKHVRAGKVMSCPEGCPQEIYDLMIDCWAMEPSDRPTAGEIHVGLQRWSPDLSHVLQNGTVEKKQGADYQNMEVVRGFAEGEGEGGLSPQPGGGQQQLEASGGQFEMSMTDTSVEMEGSCGDKVTVV